MTQELRCDSRKHGVLVNENTLEVKCSSRFCGHQRGVVVLHRFDTRTGEMIATLKYKNPERKG